VNAVTNFYTLNNCGISAHRTSINIHYRFESACDVWTI